MKMVDFDVAEAEYNINKNKDIDIYSISYNKLVEKLRHPQKYVLLKAFGEIYSLEIQDVTDTAFFLKLTDDAIKHYTRVEEKIVNENKELKKENEELKKEKKEILDTINNKITEKGVDWYKAEDNYFEDNLKEEMNPTVFSEMWDIVKRELKNYMGD